MRKRRERRWASLSTGSPWPFCHTKPFISQASPPQLHAFLTALFTFTFASSIPGYCLSGHQRWKSCSRWHKCTKSPSSACDSNHPDVILRKRLFPVLLSNCSSWLFVGLAPGGTSWYCSYREKTWIFLETRILSYKNAQQYMEYLSLWRKSPLVVKVGKKMAKN